LVWGTAVMAFSGLVLWFPASATLMMPVWIVKVSEIIHYYEAILATLAILLYHMFFAIFHPADYPINLTSFTGKITKEEAEERFPAWYRSLEEKSGHSEKQ
jgi:cytochrome b subunit of formate dehydrogenase